MESFKYNVGDKVINLSSLSLWDNSINFEQFKNSFIKTVTSANEKYFSVTAYNVDNFINFDRMNDQYVFNQKDGSRREPSYTIDTHLYHFVHDHDRIVAFVKKKIAESFDKAQADDDKEIASLEEQISRLQARVDMIKAGNRPSISRSFPQRQFLKDQEIFIMKSLGIDI